MSDGIDTCPIWGQSYVASGYFLPATRTWVVEDSPRAGGGYEIGQIACSSVWELDDPQRARLTTMLIDQRALGVSRPIVSLEMVEDARRRRPLPIYQRAERLLRYFVELSNYAGHHIGIGDGDPVELGAIAWSESQAGSDIDYFNRYLEQNGWVQLRGGDNIITVLIDGYNRVADKRANVDASQAFVAMCFSDETKGLYKQGIQPAIEDAGYVSMRIDEKTNLNKTDDEIIAEIRRSRFLVADFTHGEDGARGSVYFEAGFAYGLNIPVIHACRSDLVQDLHFDTRQYHHILWNESDFREFRKNLRSRIIARIGPGPELATND